MPEKEPQYFKKFRMYVEKRFDQVTKDTKEIVERAVDNAVGELAALTSKHFDRVDKQIGEIKTEISEIKDTVSGMATKEDLKPIHELIGKYEVRAQKVDQILLDDHEPRIARLEKEIC